MKRAVARVGDDYLGFVTGGEPVDGCEAVALLIVGRSRTAVEARARELGVWHPSILDRVKLSEGDVALALADAGGFVWRPAHETAWRTSDSWPRRA
jgi:hypothetical protein